jgi:VWFA-related protein
MKHSGALSFMSSPIISLRRLACAVLISLTALSLLTFGQQTPPPDAQTGDVLRIDTELIQTGVTVLDKQGRFVEGLKPEQFELKVDGKPVPFSFFDRVTAWTAREEKQLAAAGGAKAPVTPDGLPSGTSYRGRTIIFFVDDLHLSLEGLGRTRAAMTRFLEREMTPRDQVAFTSASGQIGFLQQLTDNKAVLRAALARLKQIPYVVLDRDQPPMTEFIAIRILNGDKEARDFYAEELMRRSFRRTKGITLDTFYETVKNRANQILVSLENVTTTSLSSLENLLRTTAQIPGRKLIFFISDGFYLDTKNGIAAANDRLKHVTDTATRTGSVIYTIDARGLFSPFADASGDRPFDPTGRLDRTNVGEGTLSQDGLSALAGDTGGRFLKNQNYFDTWVAQMLEETSNYYLLAWRPPAEEQKMGKFKRIEVSIAGRPDLTVRLPRGFLSGQTQRPAKSVDKETAALDTNTAMAPAKGVEGDLRSALGAPSARKGLPTQLSTSFIDVPNTGTVLTASMQMQTAALNYGADGRQPVAIDIAGIILNEQGKQAGNFKTRINVNSLPSNANAEERAGVIYNYKLPLKPGLYQVRVAARDNETGLTGSDAQWIEIPDLATRRLTLSSLLIGGQFVGSTQKQATGEAALTEQVQFSVERRFRRGSHINFLTMIYNAARGASGNNAPDLEAQIRLTRDGQAIVTSPVRKLAPAPGTDLARIPYSADIALQSLPAGRYVLQVTVSDRLAQTTATQQITFDIE